MVDDDVRDARAYQTLDMPDDKRLAPNRQQGFWDGISEGPHAGPTPGRENHGAHQNV